MAKLRPHRAIRDGILAGQTLNFRLGSQQVRVSEESCLGWCSTLGLKSDADTVQTWNIDAGTSTESDSYHKLGGDWGGGVFSVF